jgi:hypothetical protein
MRVEGDLWVARYALPDTMDDAIFLGSIQLQFVLADKDRKELFMTLMRDAVADIIEQGTGERPNWRGPRLAPEHEKGGNA